MGCLVSKKRSLLIRLVAVTFLFLALPACASFYEWIGIENPEPWPASARGHWESALSYQYYGQLEKAAKELESAVKADPNMYQAWYMLGYVYRSMGKTELAKRVWEEGLQKALTGPERQDYPRGRSLAQIRAGLASLEGASKPAKARRSAPPGRQIKSRPVAARPVSKQKFKPGPKGAYAVLFSSNLKPVNATRDKARLNKLGYAAVIKPAKVRGKLWHRVWVGCCTTKGSAQKLLITLRKRGIGRGLVVMPYR